MHEIPESTLAPRKQISLQISFSMIPLSLPGNDIHFHSENFTRAVQACFISHISLKFISFYLIMCTGFGFYFSSANTQLWLTSIC